MSVTIKMDKLKALEKAIPEIADSACQMIAHQVTERSQRLVPVDTGNLLGHIGYYQKKAGYWIVIARTNYAIYVEYGTRKMAAQPYLRPALESVPLENIISHAFRKAGF